jgi:hypothetical protein
MDNDQIIDLAIQTVLAERRLLAPGDAAAHVSDDLVYEFLRYESGDAIVGFNGMVKSFPAQEVFDPNIVKEVAFEMQANLLSLSRN